MKKTTILYNEERKQRNSLTIIFSLTVFFILLLAIAISSIIAYAFSQFNWIQIELESESDVKTIVIFMIISSLIIGFCLALLIVKYPLKPVTNMITQMKRLSKGDFSARLNFGKRIAKYPIFKETSENFNKMAEELASVEMLHSDFINNFSHEFKTPIVSILGFAKILKKGNLNDEQKQEYIDIIEEEAQRLSYLANNVMNLNKVQNQVALTNLTTFNLSEQIRASVLLLENEWSKKQTELTLDFDEYYVTASEELLKEVWINLLDNAIKFSKEKGKVSVSISESAGSISVSVSNDGSISTENITHVFDKFYQVDRSHSTKGNGIGLAIVKRIVELHHGSVFVTSQSDVTTFTVKLPCKSDAE